MPCSADPLSAADINHRLQSLAQWHCNENALERVYTGQTYLLALDVLNQVARLSEAENHHPDLSLNWKTLTIRYWTHTANGITALDFDLAHQVEALLQG